MQNTILNRLVDGSKAIITHWDHFHVNRSTGYIIHRAFTIKYLDGENEGLSYVWPISTINSHFHIVGSKEVVHEAS